MAISDRDRKTLWGRSGNRCAMCRTVLVVDKTDSDREAVVGDEAHIVARSPGGPRWLDLPSGEVDSYDNLILLCRVHHKAADDQSGYYTAERLRQTKASHEAWVTTMLDETEDVRLVDDPTAPEPLLTIMWTGDDVWRIIDGAHMYYMGSPADGEVEPHVCDLADQFLQQARDWGEVSSEVNDQGHASIREAKRALSETLIALHRCGLVAFGARGRKLLRGGVGPPSRWPTAIIHVVKADDPGIVVSPPKAGPAGCEA